MIPAALRKHATTIVLSVLAAGGAIFLATVDRGAVTTQEAESRKRNLLDVWRADEITEVAVISRGRTARLTRGAPDEDGNRPWQVEIDGQRYAADAQTVDQYLGSIELGVFERRVSPESVDRVAFGLDAPVVDVAITTSGRVTRLVLGKGAPTPPGAVYAEVPGRGVFVITAQLRSALDVDPDSFRSRSVVPYLAVELAGLHLDGKGGPRRLERAPWGGSRGPAFRFESASPERGARVNEGALDKILIALAGLQADVFLTEDEARQAPPAEVTLTLLPRDPGQKRAVIAIGGACPGKDDLLVAIRREPTELRACVPRAPLEALSMPASELADRSLIAAPFDAVSEIKITSGDRALELARRGTKWHLRAPSDRDVDADVGRGFVETILSLESAPLVPPPSADPKELGLSPPRAVVRVVSTPEGAAVDGGSGERIETLEIGAEQGDLVHVRRMEDGALLAVPADRAGVLFPSEIALRSREVIREPLKRFHSLRIQEGGRVQRLRRTDEGGWELIEPRGEGLAADIGLASDAAEALGSLEAERWVTAKDPGAYGLDKPRMILEAEVGDPEGDEEPDAGSSVKTLRVLLGAPASEGSFARRDGDDAVFIAPKRLESAAGRWLLDRSSLLVDAGSIHRVTLEAAAGEKVVAERAGSLFRIAGAPGDRASDAAMSSRAAAIRDALGDLLAEGVVSVGKPEKHEGLDKPQLTLTIELAPASSARGREESEGRKEREEREGRERRGTGARGDKARTVRIAFGAGDVWRGTRVYYARRAGIDATLAVAQAKVKPLLDAVLAR